MKTKLENSGHKFVRRTSQSPWEGAKMIYSVEQPLRDQNNKVGAAKNMFNRNSSSSAYQKQLSNCTKTVPDQYYVRANSKKKLEPEFDSKTVSCRFQESSTSQQGQLKKDQADMKLTYIYLQSASTLQSIPTARKKISQNINSDFLTKRNQQLQTAKKDLNKLMEENRHLILAQNQKDSQIRKLSQQKQKNKKVNTVLENQLKHLKVALYDAQNQVKIIKQNNQNLKKCLQQSQIDKAKSQQKNKQITELLLKASNDLKLQKQENKQLIRIIQSNNFEIKRMKQIINKIQIQLKQQKVSNKQLKIQSQRAKMSDCRKTEQTQCPQRINPQNTLQGTPQYCPQTNKPQLKPSISCPITKYNRYIQTQSSPLEQTLKLNQLLSSQIQERDSLIKMQGRDIRIMGQRVELMADLEAKYGEAQKLIQVLNAEIISIQANKLASKYRYY